MKKYTVGLVAHVDAGKTTLAEAILYLGGKIKKPGRVDHGDTLLDSHALERARGITIFSAAAAFRWEDAEFVLVDTPGHTDFGAETERTLAILDCAVLVISGTDGVQAHTETLWRLLRSYHIPTFLFVTKCDMPTVDKAAVAENLKKRLSPGCLGFGAAYDAEETALLDDELLERYLMGQEPSAAEITGLIRREQLFPCYYGSGLKTRGVAELLSGLARYAPLPAYGADFGATVFKIGRDEKNNRLTYFKVNGGKAAVRMPVTYQTDKGELLTEKIATLSVYGSDGQSAGAGDVCIATGLTATKPGMGLGASAGTAAPLLEPVLNYRLVLPAGEDAAAFLPKLRLLEEEDPQLRVLWQEETGEIQLRLMGEIQIEVLKSVIADRFGLAVEITDGGIIYKETVGRATVGIGHFEPLRHYAEVHLLLEPGEQGSGLVFGSLCSEDFLDRNWQRLILGQLQANLPCGVLIGAPLTDMKITLVAGRAHPKHTVGGDFREAACRSLRQGLMQAESVLLEPFYQFELKVPVLSVGRAISDLQRLSGDFQPAETSGDTAVIRGRGPVAKLRSYYREVIAYTHGKGQLNCVPCGYFPAAEAAKIIAEHCYDALADRRFPAESVFCSHGSGTVVPWQEVKDYAHLDSGVRTEPQKLPSLPHPKVFARNLDIDEKELEAIMEREFGPIKRPPLPATRRVDDRERYQKQQALKKHYLIVDGYNMIFGWEGLNALAAEDLEHARRKLLELLGHYRYFARSELMVVFDGYRLKDNRGEHTEIDGLKVVYTGEGETADMYIEKLLKEIGKNYQVRVATSDALIQISAFGSGVLRMSAKELESEIQQTEQRLRELVAEHNRKNQKLKNSWSEKQSDFEARRNE